MFSEMATRPVVHPERIRGDVEALSQPRNRLNAPEAMARAQEFICSSLEAAGWAVRMQPFQFSQVLGLLDHQEEGQTSPHTVYDQLDGVNIIGHKPGADRYGTIVVGAHFDSVRDSPGADDNASGVAGLLELARVLAPLRFHHSIVLAAFDMEELGFFGSRAMVEDFCESNRPVVAVIYESIGYSADTPDSQFIPPGVGLFYPRQVRKIRRRQCRGDWSLVIFRKSSELAARAFVEALTSVEGTDAAILMRDPVNLPLLGPLLARLVPWTRGFARSDHLSFWNAGVPAFQVTDTANYRNPHYHKASDLPDTLDYDRIAAVVAATAVMVQSLDRNDARSQRGAHACSSD